MRHRDYARLITELLAEWQSAHDQNILILLIKSMVTYKGVNLSKFKQSVSL